MRIIRSSTVWLLAPTVMLAFLQGMAQAEDHAYPQTIAVLQELHAKEIMAHHRYQLFSEAALREGHPNIAHLFAALAYSESVHARQFRRILQELHAAVPEVSLTGIRARTTRENLKYATNVELAEIDREYPAYLERIEAEHHEEAQKYIRYAWSAERQHRDLIKQIQSGTGMFFRLLIKRFKTEEHRYFVNRNCGATVTELPRERCPICHQPVSTYIEIPRPVETR